MGGQGAFCKGRRERKGGGGSEVMSYGTDSVAKIGLI